MDRGKTMMKVVLNQQKIASTSVIPLSIKNKDRGGWQHELRQKNIAPCICTIAQIRG